MHLHPPRRRLAPVILVPGVVALLAICLGGTAIATASLSKTHPKPKTSKLVSAVSLAGTWTGKYSGAFSGTFTLNWKQSGSTLSGSITLSRPPGNYTVTGSVSGTAISFGAVSAGAKYSGSVSSKGTSMSGTYTSPMGGGSWSAHKTS
jgi:hypothetical protein